MVQNKSKMYLWSILQGSGESPRQFLARFTKESKKVDKFDDDDAITATIKGTRTSDLLKSMIGQVRESIVELMARAKTFMLVVEDYFDRRRGQEYGVHHRVDHKAE